MGYIKTQGLVIKEVNTGEADKIITILSKEYGKMSIIAKGARRARSRFTACTQFLCYSEFLLFEGREIHTINSCEVIESFSEVGNDLIKLTYAAHIVDLIYDTVQEEQPADKTLKLLLNTLYYLIKTDRSPELITRIFELRYLCILGYAPYVKGCMNCSKDGLENLENLLFSFRKCGFICNSQNCFSADPYALKISSGTARAIYYIVYSHMDKLFNFELAPIVLKELGYIIDRYLKERLEKKYDKLNFLKNIDNL
ncbi:MAG TPA: DNA repair protein RecO [Clostridiales bacterium]|nr:DNA repair protein RecO [Clostridiales bacterium]